MFKVGCLFTKLSNSTQLINVIKMCVNECTKLNYRVKHVVMNLIKSIVFFQDYNDS